MFKVLTIGILWLVTSCSFTDSVNREQSLPNDAAEAIDTQETQLSSENANCAELARPLNPPESETVSESELDRHFRLAYSFETAGDFDRAISHYSEASKLADCDCDRAHAEAGTTAAQEAKELLAREGMEAKPTQFFWGRLQQLTADLSCVKLN